MSLLEQYKDSYLAYSKTNTFKNKLNKTKELVDETLLKYNKPYIAFSTGKDSLCLLNIIYKQNKNIDVMFHDSMVELPESYIQLDKIKKEMNLNLHIVKNKNNVFDLYKNLDIFYNDKLEKKIQQITLNNPIREFVIENNFDLVFLGLRKQESKKRHFMLCKYGNHFYCNFNRIWECCPLSDWKGEDIWAYIFSNNLDEYIHPAYYKDKLVQDPAKIRVSWWCETNCITKGQILWLKIYYPELYNILKINFKEVISYA